jgi:hypothetical protein
MQGIETRMNFRLYAPPHRYGKQISRGFHSAQENNMDRKQAK